MGTFTHTANRAWAEMPPWARFESLVEAAKAATTYAVNAEEVKLTPSQFIPMPENGALVVRETEGHGPARELTYNAAGQLAELAGVPAGYLRSLPADLAAVNLAYGLKTRSEAGKSVVALVHKSANGEGLPTIRSMTSEVYKRLWSAKLFLALAEVQANAPGSWVAVPAFDNGMARPEDLRLATAEDVGPWTRVHQGEQIMKGKSIYYNPGVARDTFILLVNTAREIGHGLFRYVMLWNGESGGVSIGGETGMVDSFCGNNLGWGAKDIRNWRFNHVGEGLDRRAMRELGDMLSKVHNHGTEEEMRAIRLAQAYPLDSGADLSQIPQVASKITGLPQGTIKKGMEVAEKAGRYGDPRSAWSVLSGLTEYSQTLSSVAERVDVDRAAGKLMDRAISAS